MKKILIFLSTLLLAFAMCFNATASDTTTPLRLPDMPLVDTPTELSALIRRYDGAQEADKQWFWKWCETCAGIKFNVTEYDAQVFTEKANLSFTSGDIPDVLVFIGDFLNNDNVVKYGMEEGLLMPLNDLIEEYAPNIKTVLDTNPDLKTLITCIDGNIYTLPKYKSEIYMTTRSYINNRWLENLELSVPTTIDEFYDVLVAFKENDANGNGDPSDEIPFGGYWDWDPANKSIGNSTLLLNAFGLNSNGEEELFLDGDTVKLSGYEDNYYDYLKFANKIYSEGLVDEDIFTQDRTAARAKSTNDKVGYTTEDATVYITGSVDTMYDWVGLGGLTSDVNDERMWPSAITASAGMFALSANCSDPVAAIKFADIFFTQEASVFFRWGPQKDSEQALGYEGWYLDENGAFTYDYPEGYNNTWLYRVSMIMPMSGTPGSNEYPIACPNVYGFPYATDAGGIHFREEMDKYLIYGKPSLPEAYLTEDEVERVNEILSPLTTYMASMEKKFITGALELTEETFEDYRNTLKSLNVDEYISIYQTAYDAVTGN